MHVSGVGIDGKTDRLEILVSRISSTGWARKLLGTTGTKAVAAVIACTRLRGNVAFRSSTHFIIDVGKQAKLDGVQSRQKMSFLWVDEYRMGGVERTNMRQRSDQRIPVKFALWPKHPGHYRRDQARKELPWVYAATLSGSEPAEQKGIGSSKFVDNCTPSTNPMPLVSVSRLGEPHRRQRGSGIIIPGPLQFAAPLFGGASHCKLLHVWQDCHEPRTDDELVEESDVERVHVSSHGSPASALRLLPTAFLPRLALWSRSRAARWAAWARSRMAEPQDGDGNVVGEGAVVGDVLVTLDDEGVAIYARLKNVIRSRCFTTYWGAELASGDLLGKLRVQYSLQHMKGKEPLIINGSAAGSQREGEMGILRILAHSSAPWPSVQQAQRIYRLQADTYQGFSDCNSQRVAAGFFTRTEKVVVSFITDVKAIQPFRTFVT
ncbi:hypothetical protein OE88DRAFT_1727690 [Heliocybe sulcata]|uniref:Uncharacterized protein n=1 Tax=Heliocybe sulcata TaxID=5364 RepID=A0A5C3N3M4_9AGAM|nr:hypothetical protein OE88DRAFT_1727690 [Heliocybe sulcata]